MYRIVNIKPAIVLRKMAKQYSACMLLIAATQLSRFDRQSGDLNIIRNTMYFRIRHSVSHALLSALYKTVMCCSFLVST